MGRALVILLAGLVVALPSAARSQQAPAPQTPSDYEPSPSEIYPPEHPDLLDGTLSGKGDLAEDEKPSYPHLRFPSLLEPWFEFKERLADKTGINLGGSWGVLWQNYSQSLIDQDDAVGSKFTFNLSWELLNRRKPNALWYELVVEDRGPIGTELPPLQAGFGAGSIVPTAATWGEFDLGVTQNYIRQDLFNHRVQYAVGKIFAPNFIDAYPFFDDNRQFLNQTFSTSPTMPTPLRGFGMVGSVFPTPGGLYVKSGIYTNHSDDTGITIDKFFEDPEHFYHVEVGWSGLARSGVPIQARGPMDVNNVSLTAWKRDAQEFGAPELREGSEGYAFNANYLVRDDIMLFFRAGWSSGWVIDRAATVGFGWRPPVALSDLLGFGFGFAEPSNPFLPRQKTVEFFYRYQLTENLALTPDIQFISDPALDPFTPTLWVFSMRSRVTF